MRGVSGFRRGEEGQTLVVIALVVTVLLGAVALGVDAGYGLTQRRVMQNAADASALAAAKLLATNVLSTNGGLVFAAYERQAYCAAWNIANANRAFRPDSANEQLIVSWSATGAAGTFTDFSKPTPDCFASASVASGPFVNPSARFILTRASVDYRSVVASVVGQPAIAAAATAMARISGAPLPVTGPSWPMVRHFNAADFQSTCGTPCNPLTASPVVFWDSNDPNIVYNSFMGLTDLSRYSPNAHRNAGQPSCVGAPAPGGANGCTPQLLTAWDQSGRAPVGKPAQFGGSACNQVNGNAIQPPAPNGTWYSDGNENSQNFEKDCSILNWFAYLFQGTLKLDSDWSGVTWNGTTEWRERPSALTTTRATCTQVATVGLPAPSCAAGNSRLGDWVEAAQTGNVGSNIATPLQWFIDTYGTVDPLYSDLPVSNGNGAPKFGKYVVVLVYLWDCAETYRGGDPGGAQWSLTRQSNQSINRNGVDCSALEDGNDLDSHDSVDRVHLFSLAPFTFYRGLVDQNNIKGFWGGLVADASVCAANPNAPGCGVNEFSDGVFLVPPP
jgi:Flp pilus assembly protein TadG